VAGAKGGVPSRQDERANAQERRVVVWRGGRWAGRNMGGRRPHEGLCQKCGGMVAGGLMSMVQEQGRGPLLPHGIMVPSRQALQRGGGICRRSTSVTGGSAGVRCVCSPPNVARLREV